MGAVSDAPHASHHPRVGWFELFYDLVVVAAVVHGSNVFAEEPSLGNGFWLAITLLILFALWLLTILSFNTVRRESSVRRVLTLVQMLALIVASLSTSRDGGLSDATGFFWLAVAFGALALTYLLLPTKDAEGRRSARMTALFTGLAAVVFLIGSFVPESDASLFANPYPYLLAMGLALVIVPIVVSALPSLMRRGQLDREHLAERLGQLVIIVLGESFVKLVLTLGKLKTIPNPFFFALTFAVVYCIWLIYFRSVLPAGVPESTRRLRWWLGGHYLLTFGAIGTASGFAVLAVTPFDDSADALASYRTTLPLLYVMVGFTVLALIARPRERALVITHATATVLLFVLAAIGAFEYTDHAMSMTAVGALIVIGDTIAVVRLRRRQEHEQESVAS